MLAAYFSASSLAFCSASFAAFLAASAASKSQVQFFILFTVKNEMFCFWVGGWVCCVLDIGTVEYVEYCTECEVWPRPLRGAGRAARTM